MAMFSQAPCIWPGSMAPSSTNTMPFSVNEMVRHTLLDTMLRRDSCGSTVRVWMMPTSPMATTARMPLTWKNSAAR